MISRGLQIAANGMLGLIENQDAIAHNLANVNTAGYKKEALIFKNVYNSIVSEPQNRGDYKYRNHQDVGMLSMGSQSHKLVHEFLQGTLSRTDRPLDVAIQGDGFFKVRGVDGSYAYTRNGNFVINSQNFLTDNDGNLVMDRETGKVIMTAAQSREAFKQWIENDSYAKNHRGQYAERNSNLSKWEHEIDLHLAQTIYNIQGMGKLEFTFDIINFANMLNKKWGASYESAYNLSPLTLKEFAADKTTPLYYYNNAEIKKSDISSRWHCQVGVRLTF